MSIGAAGSGPGPDGALTVSGELLSDQERRYIAAARAPNTLRGYRSDWTEFTAWCAAHGLDPLPASPAALSGYLSMLAGAGAKVGTMSRRLSAIKFAHRTRNLPNPADDARVVAVWEGIRREHAQRPDQAAPLMPPELFDVLDACPTTKTWRTRGRFPEPSVAGARDRALLLVGFVGALRRSEISALDLEHVKDHANGLVLSLPRSKTNQRGTRDELVVLPRGTRPDRCPVTVLQRWIELAAITDGPLFRPVSKGNRPMARRLTAGAVNDLVAQAATRAGLGPANADTDTDTDTADPDTADPDTATDSPAPAGYSAHSLRAGFVTYAHTRGASDRAIAHQTRHRSLASVGTYVRIHTAWQDNAATQLGL